MGKNYLQQRKRRKVRKARKNKARERQLRIPKQNPFDEVLSEALLTEDDVASLVDEEE